MSALLFGSISTLADTSELQRTAFNRAFAEHGLDWEWGREEYRDLLTGNGGEARIAEYASGRGEDVDAAAVHAKKSRLFQEALKSGAQLRPGVGETIRAAADAGWVVGFVTTTSRENLDALFAGFGGVLDASAFAIVTDVDSVPDPKPSPAVYRYALDRLGVAASDAVAIEDNVGGVEAATAAGITCLAFPNENTAGHDFGSAPRVETLDFERVRSV